MIYDRQRTLAGAGLTTAGYRLWKGRCFETANFSDDELAHVAAKYLELPNEHRFTASQLSSARKQMPSVKDAIRACLRGSGYNFDTGRKWGEELALWALAAEERQEEGERPMVSDLLMVFRSAHASFTGTVTRFRVDEEGKLKEREPANDL